MIERSRALFLDGQIATFDFSKILAYHARKYEIAEGASHRILKEVKRWLVLCAANPNPQYLIFGAVDHFWHTLILFTADYSKLCGLLGKFVHHYPETKPRGSATDEDLRHAERRFRQYLNDYVFVYGDSPDEEFLPSIRTSEHEKMCAPGSGECHTACGGGVCSTGEDPDRH